MSTFEHGYCNLAEYEAGEENRIRETSLQIGRLYTLMFLLEQGAEYDAAKYPSRIMQRVERQDGMFTEFAILDADLEQTFQTTGTLRDGYFLPNIGLNVAIDNIKVVGGYFSEDFMDGDTEQELQTIVEQGVALAAADTRPLVLV